MDHVQSVGKIHDIKNIIRLSNISYEFFGEEIIPNPYEILKVLLD